jgi:hypothetical protein
MLPTNALHCFYKNGCCMITMEASNVASWGHLARSRHTNRPSVDCSPTVALLYDHEPCIDETMHLIQPSCCKSTLQQMLEISLLHDAYNNKRHTLESKMNMMWKQKKQEHGAKFMYWRNNTNSIMKQTENIDARSTTIDTRRTVRWRIIYSHYEHCL